MFQKKQLIRWTAVGVLSTVLFITSCKKDNNDPNPDPEDKEYSYILSLSLPTANSYPFHTLKDITSAATVNISGSQELTGYDGGVLVNGKDGAVFINTTLTLNKYTINENGLLVSAGSLSNLGISSGPISTFLTESRMLVSSGPRSNTTGNFEYQIINTTNFTLESSGTINLPVDGPTSTAYPNAYILKEGKIYVPYIHTNEDYEAYDEAPIAIFNATNMAYEKTIYTDKTASLGYSVVSGHGTTENGDLYVISCNSNYWGANESKPSGIVRIKSGQSEFDNSYFFDITAKTGGNHTGGFLYVGNNKAIVQVFRSDLITAYRDYANGYVIEYYVADLAAQTLTKLNMPLSRNPKQALSLLKDGKAVIVSNTQTEGSGLYIYDPSNGTLSKGLTYTGTETIESFRAFE